MLGKLTLMVIPPGDRCRAPSAFLAVAYWSDRAGGTTNLDGRIASPDVRPPVERRRRLAVTRPGCRGRVVVAPRSAGAGPCPSAHACTSRRWTRRCSKRCPRTAAGGPRIDAARKSSSSRPRRLPKPSERLAFQGRGAEPVTLTESDLNRERPRTRPFAHRPNASTRTSWPVRRARTPPRQPSWPSPPV